MADISKITLPNGDEYNLKDTFAREELAGKGTYSKPSTGIPYDDLADDAKMTILSYGKSTWAQFLAAYTTYRVVYCRASSNSNPASGSQTRLAFMAYVNNEANPTEVEFQYYRSVNTHSDSQQGDQVYVYKLNSSGTWTVTVRSAFSKIVAGSGLDSSYSNGTLTITNANESKTAAENGTDISLVTTGEKYIWNNKADTTTATTSNAGLMSSSDKSKLDNLNKFYVTDTTPSSASSGDLWFIIEEEE